jgi:hypothetical protein
MGSTRPQNLEDLVYKVAYELNISFNINMKCSMNFFVNVGWWLFFNFISFRTEEIPCADNKGLGYEIQAL